MVIQLERPNNARCLDGLKCLINHLMQTYVLHPVLHPVLTLEALTKLFICRKM